MRKQFKGYLVYCSLLAGLLGFTISNCTHASSKIEIEMTVVRDSVVVDTVKVKKPELLNLTEANLLRVIKEKGIKHPEIVLAQAKLETGNFTSKLCKNKNNLFGLKKGNSYRGFNHWTESVEAYKNLIQNKYKGGCYYSFLTRIGYASDPNYVVKLKNV